MRAQLAVPRVRPLQARAQGPVLEQVSAHVRAQVAPLERGPALLPVHSLASPMLPPVLERSSNRALAAAPL